MKKILMFLIFFVINYGFMYKEVYGIERNKEININFDRLTIEDGLSQTSVEYIYQDNLGYIWFATNDGLNKFDGENFEVIRVDPHEENTLSANYITCIIQDKEEYLWVGTINGLNRINLESGEIKQYLSDGKSGSLSNYGICEIFIDSKDRMWVSTLDGVNIYNKEKDIFERVLYSEEKEILTSQVIYSVIEDKNGLYWIATDYGLNSYNEKTNEVKWYKADGKENSISVNEVYDLLLDEDTIWISTIQGGLNRLNIDTGKIDVFKHDPENSKSIPGNDVKNVLKDSYGNIWVATDKGLAKFDNKTLEFTNYKSKLYDTTSLVSSDIVYMFEDKLGVIWIGTDKGVSYFYPESIFNTYREDPFNENSISDNMIKGIYEDEEGLLWVGTSKDGLNIIDRDKMTIDRISNEASNENILTSDKINIIEGNNEYVWVGTNFGLNKINKNTREITAYFNNSSNTLQSVITEIYIDSTGLVWIGTRDGLFTIDKNDNIYSYKKVLSENNIKETYIATIFEDCDGEIWIGFGSGDELVSYNRETEKITKYTANLDDEKALTCGEIRDITGDSYGNVWIATAVGLNKFNKNTGVFTRYLESDGLSNNSIYSVLLDNDNNPWISTNYGINKYDMEKEIFITFDISDGLQGNEFNEDASFLSKTGEMFFGGINGFNSFFPRNFKNDSYNEPVKISKINISGRSVKDLNNVKLESDENNITIKYFVPDYRNSKSLEFRYMVEGVDSDWTIVENIKSITYNNFDSGNYKFKIQSRNSYGEWSDLTTLSFTKKAPMWRSPGAICVYIIIAGVIIFITINKVKILEGLIQQRTKELDTKLKRNEGIYKEVLHKEKIKNNYFVNLSHELRTPLNVISSSIQLIKSLNNNEENISKSKLEHYMLVLENNSGKLLKLINDIIDTSKIEAGAYKLRLGEHDIIYIVEDVVMSMKDYIESKGIELIVDPEMEEQLIECDPDEIEKCIINILSNAAKFTPEGGKIEIYIKEYENNIHIDFKDTGIGIDQKDLEFIFERFGQSYNQKAEGIPGSGIGLALTKQIALLHKGDVIVKSKLGEGSTFTIILPIK